MYNFTLHEDSDPQFKRYLQSILNTYHASAYPGMCMPQSKSYSIRVMDSQDQLVGGAIIWLYWGWLEISLLALEPEARKFGLGRHLMEMIEAKAQDEGCTRLRTEAFEQEIGFYQRLGFRIVGQLDDYPPGYRYYWLRKDLPILSSAGKKPATIIPRSTSPAS